MPKIELDAKDALGVKDTDDGEGSINEPLPDQPTEEEFQEAASPELSLDEFVLGDRTFKIRISNIRTQKIMAKALDAITDLIKKIDLKPIIESFQDKINRDRKKLVDRISASKDDKAENQAVDYEKMIHEMAAEDENTYIDMIELVRDIITHGGISNIIETILDLYAGIVYAICNSQDKTITKEWVEDNLTLFDAQEIFFNQMAKDRMGGKVIDFLYVITRQVVKKD